MSPTITIQEAEASFKNVYSLPSIVDLHARSAGRLILLEKFFVHLASEGARKMFHPWNSCSTP